MKTSRGFAIVSAIFLLVVLAALGAFMLSMSNTQQVTSIQDLQGSRAYRAAQAGMEWAVARLCGPTAGCTAPLTACPAASTTLDDGDSVAPADLDEFTVVVTCTLNEYNEGGTPPERYIFRIVSTATSGGAIGDIGYIERELDAFVEF